MILYLPLERLAVEYDDILELPIFSILIDEVLSFKSSPTYDASEVNSFLSPLKSASLYIVTLYPDDTLIDEIASFLIQADIMSL